jgi:cyclohexa-1,5-dienecarbonyl-CoA hydratase
MTYSAIQFHPGPRVSSIILNRPPLNIIDVQMIDELGAAWDEIDEVGSQIVVISGSGDRAFSAGVDVRDHVPERVDMMLDKFHGVIRRIYGFDSITIASIQGHTLGGGAELAMVCDLVIAADDTQFGLPEIGLACYPPVAAAYLPRAIGIHKASELVLLGEPISASEVARLGLINAVVPRVEFTAKVDEYVDRLLTKSSAALTLAKRALREGSEHRFLKALKKTEELYLEDLMRTDDMREGIQAFLEKRLPSWKNR